MKAAAKVEFTPPKDAQIPQQEDPDADFDMVCSFRSKPDGTVCMTKFGDSAMPGYDKGEAKENKPSYAPMAQQMMAQRPAGTPAEAPANPGNY